MVLLLAICPAVGAILGLIIGTTVIAPIVEASYTAALASTTVSSNSLLLGSAVKLFYVLGTLGLPTLAGGLIGWKVSLSLAGH